VEEGRAWVLASSHPHDEEEMDALGVD